MTNFYEVLDIPRDADESTIKRAWAKLVRIHTPDKDPEGNRRIGEAKSVLLDPRARADHDAQINYGDDIQSLFQVAHLSMEEENFEEAVSAYKEILALHPSSLDARNQLGLAYAYLEEFQDSVKQFEILIKNAPDSALYAANLGQVYSQWCEYDESKWGEAEKWLRKATELESYNSSHYLGLAFLYREKRMYDRAEQAVEEAIGADGKTDIDDLDAMMALTWIYLFADQKNRIAEVAERIRKILPDDEEAHHYAAFLFIKNAGTLAIDYQRYEEADIFIKAAKRIHTDFGELNEVIDDLELRARVHRDAERMIDEENIAPTVVPAIIGFSSLSRLGFNIPDETFDRLADAARTWAKADLQNGIDGCRRKYPAATEFCADMFPTIMDLGMYSAPRSSVGAGGKSGTGCVIPIVVIALVLIGGAMIGLGFAATPTDLSQERFPVSRATSGRSHGDSRDLLGRQKRDVNKAVANDRPSEDSRG